MANNNEEIFKNVISHAKEYGFIFQSSEIYDGLSAVYDYGQLGAELKNNIKTYWWKAMVQMHENIVGIDSAIFMHPKVWKASGHVDGFNDPMIDNKDSKKRYRADQLIEDKITAYNAEGETQKAESLQIEMDNALKSEDLPRLKALIEEHNIQCPISKTANWTDVRQFNLMFSTQFGAMAEGSEEVYLRPETAQGIFVNFLNVQKSGRMKVPFGIAQIGKAFRNEVIARQFIMRMREFEQMEMQFFVRPGTEMEWYNKWKETRLKWHLALGTSPAKYKYHDHAKLAHYANAAVDIEYEFPFGFKEMEGIHSRTDFDLKAHQDLSRKKQQYFDPEINENYIPYVVETSVGADRLFLAILCNAYTEETVGEGDQEKQRVFLNFHPALAPVKVAVLPLVKKDGLAEKAQEITNSIKFAFNTTYDDGGAIGKRYTRQDLIGTPYCVVVDYQTMEDNTVTVRDRNTMTQERISIADLKEKIGYAVSMERIFEKLLS